MHHRACMRMSAFRKFQKMNRLKDTLSKISQLNKKFNFATSIRSEEPLSLRDGPLKGTIAAIKDNIATTKEPTTCSSRTLESYYSPFESTVTELLTENGSTIVAKTNLDEFGMGSGSIHSHFGPVINPRYSLTSHVAGGSSGGSAAIVALGLVDFALGTDTGGSVRLPASHCGVVGFKPSYGLLSRWGVVPYAQSLDTVGILARQVETIEKVFKVLNKYDTKDPTSLPGTFRSQIDENVNSFHSLRSKSLKIGVVRESILEDLSEEVSQAWESVLIRLLGKGHEIVPVSIPSVKASLPAYFTLAPAEASSNLARYDGIKFGYRDDLRDSENGTLFAPTRTHSFGPEVRNRIILGAFNLSSDAFKNHFLKAKDVRKQLIKEFNDIFRMSSVLQNASINHEGVDVIISPVCTHSAPSIEQFTRKDMESQVNSFVNDVLTVPASLAGLPAISVPWQKDEPIGMQVVGQYGDDELVMELAKDIMSH